MARVRLDRGQLARVIQGEARRTINERAQQVLNRAKVLAPVDTGRLRASGKIRYSSLFSFRPKATVIFDTDYAAFVNDGTRPHVIRPRNKQVLRFTVGGRVVFAKVVHHPGTRPNPFLDRALSETLRGSRWRVT